MTFKEYVEEHRTELQECDCGAEYMHPRTCAYVASWDKITEGWRQSGLTLEEGKMMHPDFCKPICSACRGPFHEATGHAWSPILRLCNGCTRDFIKWIKHREANMGHVRKGQAESFTDAALKSVKVN